MATLEMTGRYVDELAPVDDGLPPEVAAKTPSRGRRVYVVDGEPLPTPGTKPTGAAFELPPPGAAPAPADAAFPPPPGPVTQEDLASFPPPTGLPIGAPTGPAVDLPAPAAEPVSAPAPSAPPVVVVSPPVPAVEPSSAVSAPSAASAESVASAPEAPEVPSPPQPVPPPTAAPAAPRAGGPPVIVDKVEAPKAAKPEPEAPKVVVHEVVREVIKETAPATPVIVQAPAAAPAAPPTSAPAPLRVDATPVGTPPPIRDLGEELVELPDVTPPPAKKEPLFTWRGKPIGGGGEESTGTAVEKRPTGPNRTVAAGGNAGYTWFEEAASYAMDVGASDMHFIHSGKDGVLTCRIRIDGILRDYGTIEGVDASVVMGRFKTQANLSTGGNYAPEEAMYPIMVDGVERRARVALFRTSDGGNAMVLRLPPSGPLRTLDKLEFAPKNLDLFYKLLKAANKMIIIAGPMGSGKTTTAHGAIAHIATPGRAVWTVEDPVERDLPNVTQLEIDEDNNAGFDALLPSLVRADYDTLFLGEIRDKATAAAGVRQAKAGRQVISTIHANDNVTALIRLIDLAQDSALSVLDAVLGVVSQRLVRRLNPEWDGVDEDTKYKGRVPIHEVLLVTEELIEAFMREAPIGELRQLASQWQAVTFEKDAARLIAAGITDQTEIDRVLGAPSDRDD